MDLLDTVPLQNLWSTGRGGSFVEFQQHGRRGLRLHLDTVQLTKPWSKETSSDHMIFPVPLR